jgi:hypothetical protein
LRTPQYHPALQHIARFGLPVKIAVLTCPSAGPNLERYVRFAHHTLNDRPGWLYFVNDLCLLKTLNAMTNLVFCGLQPYRHRHADDSFRHRFSALFPPS